MKLKRLKIGSTEGENGFKNLKNFEIFFEDNNGVNVIIGNNGSGKSNILEAISAIFTGLLKMTKLDRKPGFDYELEYNFSGAPYKISLKKNRNNEFIYKLYSGENKILVKDMQNNPSRYLPSNIIAIYSGEEDRLWNEYYSFLYKDFMKEVKGEHFRLSMPKMLFMNRFFWNISLLTLLYSSLDKNISFCKRILKIDNLDDVKITFKFNETNIESFKENSVVGLIRLIQAKGSKFTIDEIKEFEFITSERQLFMILIASAMNKGSKMIEEIEINYKNNLTTESLSEGEKKQILLRTALEVVADEKSLILFDEPDANIHVANKGYIKDMIKEYLNREIIITTHSPTVMKDFRDNLIYLENGKKVGKENAEILNEISDGIMTMAEQQIILHSNKDIILVEGKTDELYIRKAIEKLDEERYAELGREISFIPTGGASGLYIFINKFRPNNTQRIFSILDADEAGEQSFKAVVTQNNKDLTQEQKTIYTKAAREYNTRGDYNYNGADLIKLPKPHRITNNLYEIEDYFPLEKLLSIGQATIDTYKVLKDFTFNKGSVKRQLEREYGEYVKDDFLDFKLLLDKIIDIKNRPLNN